MFVGVFFFPLPSPEKEGKLMRSGPASAAHAIGVPEMIIKFYGHWAKNSSVWNDYIDQTVRPTPAGRFFFGWLLEDAPEERFSDSDAEG